MLLLVSFCLFQTKPHQQNTIIAFKLLVATVFINNIDETYKQLLKKQNFFAIFGNGVGGGGARRGQNLFASCSGAEADICAILKAQDLAQSPSVPPFHYSLRHKKIAPCKLFYKNHDSQQKHTCLWKTHIKINFSKKMHRIGVLDSKRILPETYSSDWSPRSEIWSIFGVGKWS